MVSAPILHRVSPRSSHGRHSSGSGNHDLYRFSRKIESVDGVVSLPSCKPQSRHIWEGGEGGTRGTPLHELVTKREIDQHDIDEEENKKHINSRDAYGQTPLMRAVWYNRKPTVKLLIANGAQIDVLDNFHKHVFTIAARRGNWETFIHLMRKYFWSVIQNNPEKLAMPQQIQDEYRLAALNAYVYPSEDRDKIRQVIFDTSKLNITLRHGDLIRLIKKGHISAIKYAENHIKTVDSPPFDTVGIIRTVHEYNNVWTAYNAAISELPGCTRPIEKPLSIKSISSTSRGGTRRRHKKTT